MSLTQIKQTIPEVKRQKTEIKVLQKTMLICCNPTGLAQLALPCHNILHNILHASSNYQIYVRCAAISP